MLTIIYKVKIPLSESNEYKEVLLNTRQDVCSFLKISQTTFYSILNNTLKFKHADKLYLRGIIIEKTAADIDKTDKPKPLSDSSILQRNLYIQSLIQKT